MATTKKKVLWISIASILLIGVFFIFFHFFFVFAEGTKTGELNYVTKKGYIFKTYEGKLIQSGFWSRSSGNMESNEFVFSVEDKDVAEQLMKAGGREVELEYKEYKGTLPWRGYSKYVVYKVLNIKEPTRKSGDTPLSK